MSHEDYANEQEIPVTLSRKPPTRGMDVLERVYRGELRGYERAAGLVASDRRKNITACCAHMRDSALELALSSYFLGKDEDIIPWLKKSAEAGIGLFGTVGTSFVEITTLDEKGNTVSVKKERETSRINFGAYKELAYTTLIVGDADLMRSTGDIDPDVFMDSSTMSPDPERYEEAKVLRLLCRGEEDRARALLASWDGRETVAQLKSFGVGDDPQMPALRPWRGLKFPLTRCIEAILQSDEDSFATGLKDMSRTSICRRNSSTSSSETQVGT
ncbi:MAG: hypothetical protein ACYTKD_29615 [Planctomycetota bacterium]